MFTKPNLSSGIPLYIQVKEQILHAIELGALPLGAQLPSVRGLAEQLIINPHTVLKIYKELEVEGVIEVRHGSGAFVTGTRSGAAKTELILQGTRTVEKFIRQLLDQGVSTDEIRRMVESELLKSESAKPAHLAWNR